MAPTLEDLKNIYIELGEINDKQEKRVRYLETTSIKLAIAYIFFQALVFMSFSQKLDISCKQWWIPYGLSSLVGVIFAMTFNRFIGKWERIQYHLDISFTEREAIYHRMTLLKESQESSTYDQLMKPHPEDEILKCDIVKVYQRKAFVWIVSSALFAYTALIVTASQSVLCHRV